MSKHQQFCEKVGIYPIAVHTPFPVGPVMCYLWKGDVLTLIDTGPKMDESLNDLRRGLAEYGVALADIERLILTHHHLDHCGLTQHILDASNAEVWGHPDIVNQARRSDSDEEDDSRRRWYEGIMVEFGVPENEIEMAMSLWRRFSGLTDTVTVHKTLDDGATVGPFQAFYVPGHSSTDTLLHNAKDKYTMVGDHLLEKINPNPLLRRPNGGEPREKALIEFQASLKRSRSLELGWCFPGHGKPFTNHYAVIDGILSQHERKNNRTLKWMKNHDMTPYALAMKLYPSIGLAGLYLGLSVAVGQLEVLEAMGEIKSSHRDGILTYTRSGK